MLAAINVRKDFFDHIKTSRGLLVIVAIATRLATIEPLLTVIVALEFFLAWWLDNVLAVAFAALTNGELINAKIVDAIFAVTDRALRDCCLARHFICIDSWHHVRC